MEHPQKGRPNPAEPHRPRRGPPPPHTLACPTAPRASGPSLLTAATVPATPPTHTPPAGLPPAANRKPVARRTAHLNSPIGRPPISPSLYGERGCALLTLLADARRSRAPPSSLRRAHLERGKSQPSPRPQRGGFPGGREREGGPRGGSGSSSPAAGSASSGAGGQLEWKIPGRRPREPGRRQPCPPTRPRKHRSSPIPGFLREGAASHPSLLRPAVLQGRWGRGSRFSLPLIPRQRLVPLPSGSAGRRERGFRPSRPRLASTGRAAPEGGGGGSGTFAGDCGEPPGGRRLL